MVDKCCTYEPLATHAALLVVNPEIKIDKIYKKLPYITYFEKPNKQMANNINTMIGPDIQVRVAYQIRKTSSFLTKKDACHLSFEFLKLNFEIQNLQSFIFERCYKLLEDFVCFEYETCCWF